jgi:transposase InsO family protein
LVVSATYPGSPIAHQHLYANGVKLRPAEVDVTIANGTTLKHHTAMQALFFAWYNLCRKHESLGGETPAMASGLTNHVWTIKELIQTAPEC